MDAAPQRPTELEPGQLCQRCPLESLNFETTSQVPDLSDGLGQTRAAEAIRFGIGIQREGYNLYAVGPAGTGKRSVVRRYLDEKAAAVGARAFSSPPNRPTRGQEGLPMRIRRILVALDTSPHSLAALDAAAGVAVLFKAELLGLFVEDINLVRLAGLPFAHEVGYPSAVRHKLSANGMERSLRLAAQAARDALAAVAGRHSLPWTFRVARGPVASELLAAAEDEGDLIACGKAGHQMGPQSGLGSTALGVSRDAPCTILLLPRASGERPSVAFLAGGVSPAALKSAETAALLAYAWAGGLALLVPRGDRRVGQDFERAVAAVPGVAEAKLRFHRLAGARPAAVARAARDEQAGALVIAGSPALFDDADLADLVEKTGCRVLLVRRQPLGGVAARR